MSEMRDTDPEVQRMRYKLVGTFVHPERGPLNPAVRASRLSATVHLRGMYPGADRFERRSVAPAGGGREPRCNELDDNLRA